MDSIAITRTRADAAVFAAARAVWRAIGGMRAIILLLGTAAAYAAVARLSLLYVLEPQHVAGIWPAAGVALGLLLVNPRNRWPAILAGVAVGVAVANLAAGTAPSASAAFVLANTLEPLVAAAALRRTGFVSLGRLRDVGRFITYAVVVGPLVGGVIGAGAAAVVSGAPFVGTYVIWTLGNAGGVLAISPLILHGRARRITTERRWARHEAVAIAAALLLVAGSAFLPAPTGLQLAAYPAFLILVLAALRFGLQGAAFATFALGVIATAGTIAGHGPIALLNHAARVQIGQVHVLVAVAFLISFVTAAAMEERRLSAEALEAQMTAQANRAAINERVAAFAREIARTLASEAIFQQIVQEAVAVVPADIAMLSMESNGGPAHRVVAAIGAPRLIGGVVDPGDGVTGRVIRDGIAAVVQRIEPEDLAEDAAELVPTDGPMAVASAPVLIAESVAATIGLARFDVEMPFTADELHALEMMAGLTAVALTNATEFGKAQDRSIRDELTGLPNRRYFSMAFEQLNAQWRRQAAGARIAVSAILFDLDHFGSVNKERGHETGDRVLAEFGRVLAARLRRADIVARYGGEEFIALLMGTEREAAMQVADEIRIALEGASISGADGDPIHCTVSVGVATASPTEVSLDGLIATADVALSMAKRAGRNTVAAA